MTASQRMQSEITKLKTPAKQVKVNVICRRNVSGRYKREWRMEWRAPTYFARCIFMLTSILMMGNRDECGSWEARTHLGPWGVLMRTKSPAESNSASTRPYGRCSRRVPAPSMKDCTEQIETNETIQRIMRKIEIERLW